jgi:hypothetical protein
MVRKHQRNGGEKMKVMGVGAAARRGPSYELKTAGKNPLLLRNSRQLREPGHTHLISAPVTGRFKLDELRVF